MDKEGCGCHRKGRLFISIESTKIKKINIKLIEENNYQDIYTVDIKNGKGSLRVDGISYGYLSIRTNMDNPYLIYYPDRTILFEKNNYVHKLTLIDRRK